MRVLALLVMSSLAFSVAPAHAGDRLAYYVADEAAPLGINMTEGTVGTIFASGTVPASIRVEDANGAGVGVYVCQNGAGGLVGETDVVCGDEPGSDIMFHTCSTNQFISLAGKGFVATRATWVVIANVDAGGCPTFGTAGAMTVRF